ncbi:MAG: prolipoprotein diacylglyceryl transferase [Elusimicrobiales bacterium]
MHPYLFSIGDFRLASYGAFAAAGYLAAMVYARYNARRAGFDLNVLWDLFAALIAGALLGGKIAYVALLWNSFPGEGLSRMWAVLRDFRNGFVFLGGFAGGAAAGYWFSRRAKFSFWAAADMLAPAIALGHAIGRIGCFMAGCCHGSPSHFLAVRFTDPDCLVSNNLLGVPLHPAQLYESAGNFALFAILHTIYPKRRGEGAVFAAYCAGYSVLRFCLEFLRGDERGGGAMGLSPSQIGALFVLALCAVYYARRHAKT